MGGLFTTPKVSTGGGVPPINGFVLDWLSIYRTRPVERNKLESWVWLRAGCRESLPRQYCLSSRRGSRSRQFRQYGPLPPQ